MVALVVTPGAAGRSRRSRQEPGRCARRSDPARIKDVLSAYTPSADPEARTALLQVMGRSGNPEALAVLRAALNDQDANARRAAILALTEWPDITPVPDLMAAARSAANPAQQVLALRGAIQLIGLPAPARPRARFGQDAGRSHEPGETGGGEARGAGAACRGSRCASRSNWPGRRSNDREVAAEAKAAVARLERTVRN